MTSLFQATKRLECGDVAFDMPEGPAFATRQEAEAWLADSGLGVEFKVQEVAPFAL